MWTELVPAGLTKARSESGEFVGRESISFCALLLGDGSVGECMIVRIVCNTVVVGTPAHVTVSFLLHISVQQKQTGALKFIFWSTSLNTSIYFKYIYSFCTVSPILYYCRCSHFHFIDVSEVFKKKKL